MLKDGQFPTREACDLNEPSEAFLWCFAGMPGVRGAPLLLPIEYLKLMSQRLWDLGARMVAEPTLEWVAPQASDPNWLTSPGRWVPVGSAPRLSEADRARNAMAQMSAGQKAKLLGVLESGVFDDSPAGRTAAALSVEQREVVLKVLKGEGDET